MNRIRLGNTVFEGLNDAYLLGADDGEGPVTLVDTGIATPDVRVDLEDGLAAAGVEVGEIEQVLLTHWHEDHAGLAGWIQEESGATVRAHTADVPLIEGDAEARERMEVHQRALFAEWGMPAGPREELLEFVSGFEAARGDPPIVEPFEDGDRFQAGVHEIEVCHLPGHTAGLSGFVTSDTKGLAGTDETDETDGPVGVLEASDEERIGAELFSGDALLPHYTPNVGGADVRVDRALEKYLTTLSRIVDRDFSVAWPGHRDPIADPTARAIEIATHHRERTENVVGILREHGPADAWTVSSHLFGALEEIHILHGPGEAYAHLDHLTGDVVERERASGEAGTNGSADGEERVTYRLIERDPDLDHLFPEIALGDA